MKRETLVLWLYGSLLGLLAYSAASFHLGAGSSWPRWIVALVLAIVATPIHIVVDLTFPLWGRLGAPGPWLVAALTAGLCQGLLAIWIVRTYRRGPGRAFGLVAVLVLLQLGVYVAWQSSFPPAR